MSEQPSPQTERQRVIATVARLVMAADGDTPYRDVYLRRAAELLTPIVSATRYASAVTSREQVAKLMAQARVAVGRQDWQQVQALGTQAADLQRSLGAEKESIDAADTVYAAPHVVLDPFSPGLTPASKRWSGAAQARTEVMAALTELARDDAPARELYAARQRALEALAVPGAEAPGKTAGPAAPTGNVEQHALRALEQGDAAALKRIADSMLGGPAVAASAEGAASTPGARGRVVVPGVLAEPLPASCVSRAAALGLEPVETTLASPELAAAITDFVERYAIGASPAAFDRARDGVARLTVTAERVDIPQDVAGLFADTISLLALHLYVNSAGVRYVPLPVPRETLLVESHAEGEEPATPLLRELGLPQRRGLPRDDIEAALWTHGPRILADHLGLDPLAFRIVCVPCDVYVRLGQGRGWGKRPEWTHFDGYQVLTNGRLRALVGGNAKFGGLFDLCSISRDDGRENTVVRFVVARRERFGVRLA